MARASLRHRVILGLTLGVGISLSAIAALFVHRWEVSQQQTQFQQQIENLAIALQRSLNRYTDVLIFLGDHYRVAQGQVQRQDFVDFVTRSLTVYPGIQALEWAPLVLRDNRRIYEQTVQAEGHSSFYITELGKGDRLIRAGDRPYYIPVTYIAPFSGNEAALGFDLNSSPVRAAALEPARDTGEIHATGRIRLVQEQGDQYGFLVVLPLYQTVTLPTSREIRQAGFAGVLLGVFRISDVVEEALQDLRYEVNFTLHDQEADLGEQFLGRYDAVEQTVMAVADRPSTPKQQTKLLCPIPTSCTHTLEIGQRQWRIDFSPAETYPLNAHYGTWTTLFAGLLLTGSLVLFLHNLQAELIRTQTLNDLKQRFFSIASHELRTPLSTILLSTELLQANYNEFSDTQKQSSLQRIHLTAKQMSQQITDLLTLTRAEVGKLEFNPELLEVVSFCQQVIDELQAGISQPIMFVYPDRKFQAFWDQKLVRSVLSNLLSNAAKYSPADSKIQVSLDTDGHTAILRVCDRGIGILAADQAHVREAFRRGSNVGNIAGTGLGLAIVQACVDLHRGNWHIDSQAGQSTTLTVQLPLE